MGIIDELHHARPATAPGLWILSDHVRQLSPMPGTGLHLLELTVPPGGGPPLHTHASAEAFYVIEGSLTFEAIEAGERRRLILGPGETLSLASRVPHRYVNETAQSARALVIADGSLLAFFADIGRPLPPSTPPTPEQIANVMAAARRHGIEFLEAGPGA